MHLAQKLITRAHLHLFYVKYKLNKYAVYFYEIDFLIVRCPCVHMCDTSVVVCKIIGIE